MADRSKSLRRLVAVQRQMVHLSEWRLGQAEQACRDLAGSKTRLQAYVADEGALGETLARAALGSLHGIDQRIADAERQRATLKAALQGAKQREQAATDLSARADRAARRSLEDRELRDVVETWLAVKGASLP